MNEKEIEQMGNEIKIMRYGVYVAVGLSTIGIGLVVFRTLEVFV